MQPMALFDAQGRSIRRTRTHDEIMADIPPEVQEARRILREGGDPGPMPIDRLLYFGSPRHLELVKNRPDYFGIAPPDYDIDRPEDLTVHGGSLLFGPMPQALSKIMTKYGEVFMPQDLALTAQTQWKTQPGIQVITGDHGPDCCCVCCCCKEPEPPLIFMKPGDPVCPCPKEVPENIGVFWDGVLGMPPLLFPDEKRAKKQRSAMTNLCARYKGWSIYKIGSYGEPSVDADVSRLADVIHHYFCYWKQRKEGADFLEDCPVEINVDLFGYSRGGASVVWLADLLSKEFKCRMCRRETPFPPIRVRFLGVIDPDREGIFHQDVSKIPSNVDHFFQVRSDNHDRSYDIGSGDLAADEVEKPKDLHIEHEDIGDAGNDAYDKLVVSYEGATKSEFQVYAKLTDADREEFAAKKRNCGKY